MYFCKNFCKSTKKNHHSILCFHLYYTMLRIGILSDTHGTLPQQVFTFFGECDEIWHAGDIGPNVIDRLQQFKPVVAVYGNTDGWDIRNIVPQTQLFTRGKHKILMTHIGGYPGHYEKQVQSLIEVEKPDVFVAGHSHILRVMYDNKYNLLHINPGAAGQQGFHKVSTLVRFTIDEKPKDLEICEFSKFDNKI